MHLIIYLWNIEHPVSNDNSAASIYLLICYAISDLSKSTNFLRKATKHIPRFECTMYTRATMRIK